MEPAPPDPAEVVARLEQAASRIRAAAVAASPEAQGPPAAPRAAPQGGSGGLALGAPAESSEALAEARVALAEVRTQLVAAVAELDAFA